MTTSMQVICGDGIEFMRSMADASVDHVITDPPYCAYVHANMRGNRGAAGIVTRDPGFAPMTASLRRAFAREAVRVARKWIVIFSDWDSITWWRISLDAAGGSHRRVIPWIRWSSPQFNKRAPPCGSEAIVAGQPARPIVVAKPTERQAWWFGGDRTHYDVKCLRARQRLDHANKHPTEKPLELMRQILLDCAQEGDSILDPFAGAGTTGIAATRLGMRATLVEHEQRFVDEINFRIGLFTTEVL